MTTFTFTTTDATQLAALEAGRLAYNASNPQNILPDDQAFFSWIVSSTINARAAQFQQDQIAAAVNAFQAGDPSKMLALAQSAQKS